MRSTSPSCKVGAAVVAQSDTSEVIYRHHLIPGSLSLQHTLVIVPNYFIIQTDDILISQLLLDILCSNDLVLQPSQLLTSMLTGSYPSFFSSPLIVVIYIPYLRCLFQPQQFFDATRTYSPLILPSFHCSSPVPELTPHPRKSLSLESSLCLCSTLPHHPLLLSILLTNATLIHAIHHTLCSCHHTGTGLTLNSWQEPQVGLHWCLQSGSPWKGEAEMLPTSGCSSVPEL